MNSGPIGFKGILTIHAPFKLFRFKIVDHNKKRHGSKERTVKTRGNMSINIQKVKERAADFPLTSTRKGPTGNKLQAAACLKQDTVVKTHD